MKSTVISKGLRYVFPPLAGLFILAGSYFHALDNYELETLDLRFRYRGSVPTTDKVVIVEIGDDSIERLGRWPFDRSAHSMLVKSLAESGAKAIIFDIMFSEPEASDKEFAEEMRSAKNVYLPFVLELDTVRHRDHLVHARSYVAKPLDNLALFARGAGHISIIPDIDGKFRRIPLYVGYKGALHPYLSFLMTCDYLDIPQKQVKILPGKYLLIGGQRNLRIPLDENSNMIINFSGKWKDSYAHYSYVDILQSFFAKDNGQKPILDMRIFKDKICIVGLTATGTVDLHPNPFETLYPGMGIHAEVFNSVLNRRFITRVSKEANLAILILLGIVTALLTLRLKPLNSIFLVMALVAFYSGTAVMVFKLFGLWIDLFYPVLIVSLLCLSLIFYKYITEWKHRLMLENELEIAKKIQDSFLPKKLPEVKGLDIAVVMFTARKVGGDLYTFVEFGEDKLGVMMGDVSGKGVPASLFMAMVTGAFKFYAASDAKPSDVLCDLNNKLCRESSSNLFVTMFYVMFDMRRKTLAYANGGHLPLIRLRPGGNVEFLDVDDGTPLGLMEGPYSENGGTFNDGDIFVLYTDGITEAMNAKSDMYGKERLAAVIESHRALSAKALLTAIERDVRRFEPKAQQHDDMTFMVIKVGEAS